MQAQGTRTPQGEPSGRGLAAYAKLIEDYAKFGRHEEAVRMVKRMAGLRDAAGQAAYVGNLKETAQAHAHMKLL